MRQSQQRVKQPVFAIQNTKSKVIFAYSRKMDATYHHASMRFRPFIRFIELDCHLKLASYKGYTVKGDF